MLNDNILTLRQIDQTRTDFALIESNLEFIMGQLAKQPTLIEVGLEVLAAQPVALAARKACRLAAE